MKREVCVSDRIFMGFKSTVDLGECECSQDIIDFVLSELCSKLRDIGLAHLAEETEQDWSSFHIHDKEFIDFFTEDDMFYVCRH